MWINYATAKCSSLNGSNDSARASIKIFGLCLCDNKKFKKKFSHACFAYSGYKIITIDYLSVDIENVYEKRSACPHQR